MFKTLISTLLDGPVVKTKYIQYPYRYLPRLFDSNIVFLYLLFPMSCVIYNQLTYKMKPLKTIVCVFLFTIPMTLYEHWLEKNTNLVRFGKGWNSFYTFSVLSFTFWIVRIFIGCIRLLDKNRASKIFEPQINKGYC
ncbi:CBO0543 family protein [Alteribacillus bidgolensis]|uniref:CBO0543 family protein n=1 Tax=Alteribacillus bidgolensis TaxID=930129 RepID=UPI00248287C1|nr:CBO0543 family protein [Alteribacillus bidgolensis]